MTPCVITHGALTPDLVSRKRLIGIYETELRCADVGDPKASKERPTKRSMFSVSGMHTKQRDTVAEQLHGLGQAVSLDLHSHRCGILLQQQILHSHLVSGIFHSRSLSA